MRPGEGTKVSGSSALMRHSMLCPRISILPTARFEILAGRQTNLRFDQVYVRDHFGDGMLHLNARVHFDEVEACRPRRAKIPPCRRWCSPSSVSASTTLPPSSRARLLVHHRRGRFLNELLVAALDAAFALAEVDDVAVLVAQHLKFDVPRALDEFLEIYIGHRRRLVAPRFARSRMR